MTRTRAAAVLREYGAPLRLVTVTVPELRDDEVLVQIHGVGICHTDLTAAAGGVPVPRPVVPGHEGAGVVTEQGSTIVVFGLGAVGTAAVTTARISLCENIIVVAPDPRRHGLARSFGATEVLSPTITTTSDAICVASPAVVPAMRWSPWAPNPSSGRHCRR